MTGSASKSGSRHFSRVLTARPSRAADPPTSTKSLAQAWDMAGMTAISWVSWTSATSLRPSMPPTMMAWRQASMDARRSSSLIPRSARTLSVVGRCGGAALAVGPAGFSRAAHTLRPAT